MSIEDYIKAFKSHIMEEVHDIPFPSLLDEMLTEAERLAKWEKAFNASKDWDARLDRLKKRLHYDIDRNFDSAWYKLFMMSYLRQNGVVMPIHRQVSHDGKYFIGVDPIA